MIIGLESGVVMEGGEGAVEGAVASKNLSSKMLGCKIRLPNMVGWGQAWLLVEISTFPIIKLIVVQSSKLKT